MAKNERTGKNIVVYGAGYSGKKILREMKKNDTGDIIVGVLDDDRALEGKMVSGFCVAGGMDALKAIVERETVDEIILAITYLSAERIRQIRNLTRGKHIEIRIVPSVSELTRDDFAYREVRPLRIEDLLKRDVVEMNEKRASKFLEGKNVLVTGAGGSIGSMIAKRALEYAPKRLFMLGRGENSVFEAREALSSSFPKANIVPVILDIRDREGLADFFRREEIDCVYHAAAHKHVGLMETNIKECFYNNVVGLKSLVDTATLYKTANFVFVSSDKAVNPRSAMGVSKRLGELYLYHQDASSKTKFATVRFGNVLASRGSVIPIFEKQIEAGGPVTVTHKGVERFFMTISEAAALVIEAGCMTKKNDLFVLDMGNPVKIEDLARELIRLKGMEGKIAIKYTKLAPSEKMSEELFFPYERPKTTGHKKIFQVAERGAYDERFLARLYRLIDVYSALSEKTLRAEMAALIAPSV